MSHPAKFSARAIVQVNSVTVRAGSKDLLRDVDLEVQPGEIVAIVGPNGAGKSTLLSVLAGDRRPDSGSARNDAGDLWSQRAAVLARFRAVMLQDHLLAFPFLVDDVVRMGREPWRGTPDASMDDERVAWSVATAQVEHLLHRTYPTLSGGEKARASFARVLAQAAPLLLLDEPTAALDIRHQEQVLDVARSHARGGGACVIVLHDLSLASAYADRLVLLHDGRVAACGTPAEVLQPDPLCAVYEYPVEVRAHPNGPGLLVLPVRRLTDRSACPNTPDNPNSPEKVPQR